MNNALVFICLCKIAAETLSETPLAPMLVPCRDTFGGNACGIAVWDHAGKASGKLEILFGHGFVVTGDTFWKGVYLTPQRYFGR